PLEIPVDQVVRIVVRFRRLAGQTGGTFVARHAESSEVIEKIGARQARCGHSQGAQKRPSPQPLKLSFNMVRRDELDFRSDFTGLMHSRSLLRQCFPQGSLWCALLVRLTGPSFGPPAKVCPDGDVASRPSPRYSGEVRMALIKPRTVKWS